ncbi:aldo/keto reductase [Streptomyces lancefieldiae]|uniref:Aldo/keto reductase n=1 Tax=Streptomyces lancefieldiae TaxID=3075520 RepID=A0ABU3AK92_9ACTN|nr:aldo/keto reductase [Streptomyces sp. DSM 40712]MDT0610394.1 aldo/keto reductase [Streptomyces sp. DSM 40712]
MPVQPARTLGRSTVPVTPLTLGAAALGNLFTAVADDQAEATVEAAWAAGIRSFDTAPHYGLGLSERRLGRALAGRPRTDYTVSSKVGRILVPCDRPGENDLAHGFAVPADHARVWDFTADGVRRSIEHSLTRLGLDRLDVALLHDPDDHAEAAFHEAYPALERLRSEGVVGAIGAGMNQTGMLTRFVTDTDVDVVLLAGRHTLLDHSGLSDLLPAAQERGVSVLAGGVFNSGLLADPRPGARYDYAPAPGHLLSRALRLRTVVERHGVSLRAAALHYPLAHPAVVGVLIGARSPEEVGDAAALMRRPVPSAVWDELKSEGLLPAQAPTP